MAVFGLLAAGFIMSVVAVFFVICALALILIILVQKGRGGGLSSVFGGGMTGGLLGSKTGDFLTWVTVGLVGLFLILAVVMAKFYRPSPSDFGGSPPARQEQPINSEQPSAPVTPVDVGEGSDANLPGD